MILLPKGDQRLRQLGMAGSIGQEEIGGPGWELVCMVPGC